MIAKI